MKMKVTLLGTGTSVGVPQLGCTCKVCKSKDKHDKRLRTSALLETESTRILIDCGPDFRQQMMHMPFRKIDAVMLTHRHYDHVAGIDDLRPFCAFGSIGVFADEATARSLHQTMPYCFYETLYPGVPKINLQSVTLHKPLQIGDISIVPFVVMHDKMPVLAFRIGSFAYITDMKTISESEMPYVEGVKTLVVNALRFNKEHHSHMLVADAIDFAKRVGATKTVFTHTTHDIGFHDEANALLPQNFCFGYDGMTFSVDV